MSLKPVYATTTAIQTTGLNSLADGSGNSSSEQDNTSNRYLDLRLDVTVAAAAANTGHVEVYLLEGSTTAELSTTVNKSNMRFVGSVALNGTTAVRKSFFVQNAPEFWSSRVVNESGGSLASSANTVDFTGINYEDV